jgi:hypothetical protein
VSLGTSSLAAGEIWHLPVAPARTTRRLVEQIGVLNGTTPRLFAAGPTTLRAAGLVIPALREYRHTLYQFQDRWVVDDGKFRAAFGTPATPLDDALAATVEWFRTAADPDIPSREGAHR